MKKLFPKNKNLAIIDGGEIKKKEFDKFIANV